MRTALIAAFCVVFGTCQAYGAVIVFNAVMDAPGARPPNLGVGIGYATATVDDTTGAFSISGTSRTLLPLAGVSLRGPSDPPANVAGPLVIDLVFNSAQPSPNTAFDGVFSGTATFIPSQISELLAGHDFVAVYTALPGNVPTPTLGGSLVVPEPSLLGVVCVSTLVLFRRQHNKRKV